MSITVFRVLLVLPVNYQTQRWLGESSKLAIGIRSEIGFVNYSLTLYHSREMQREALVGAAETTPCKPWVLVEPSVVHECSSGGLPALHCTAEEGSG